MKAIIASFALLLGAAAFAPPARAADLSGQQRAVLAGSGLVGSPAPRLAVTTIDGRHIDLGALYGRKAVYLKFWATWCVPCREQMPHFQRAYESRGKDLEVIAVNAGFNDSVVDIETYRHRMGITMPIVLDDGRLGQAFNLRVTPQHVVIDRNGRISYMGHLADADLDAALAAARRAPMEPVAAATGPTREAAAGRTAQSRDLFPEATVQTLDHQAFALRGDAQRRPTVLVFLSPWCESYLADSRPKVSKACRDARLQVEGLAQSSRARWLGVASGLWANADDVADYRGKYGVTIPLTVDESGTLFRAFGVRDTPTMIIADADGKVVRRLEAGQEGLLAKTLEAL